jgi:DNA-directed RNA polymerase subunit RPC12/RpoP
MYGDYYHKMADTNLTAAGPAERKAVLHCPGCRYTEPVEGAWVVADSTEGRTDIECPECGTLVVTQPRFDAGSRRTPFGGVRPLLQLVHALVGHDVR